VKQNPFKKWGRVESVLQEPPHTDVCKTWVSAEFNRVQATLEQDTASEASRLD